jgi:hypothetical protein
MNPDSLPLCTDDERWYRGHAYAVKYEEIKTGKVNKNAKRKFDNLTDAKQFMTDNTATLPKGKKWAPIEERHGENIRCLDYCDVWNFCPFGRKLRQDLQAAQSASQSVKEGDGEEE